MVHCIASNRHGIAGGLVVPGRRRRLQSSAPALALGGAMALSLCIAAPGAMAQAASTDVPDSAGALLQEITVTARRREERLQDLPLAVTAFTSEDIERQGLRDITEIAQFTPGFSMQNVGSTTEQPFIRGMSVTSFERTLQTASSYQDGVYSSTLGRSVFFDDVERIEVVKGPQAALFGRATFAGAINYILRKPSFEPEGAVRVAAGEHGLLESHGSWSGPLFGDSLAVRISGNTRNYEGAYRNPLDGRHLGEERRSGVTVAATFRPNERFEASLRWLDTQFRDLGQTPIYMQPASTNNCFANAMGQPQYYCGDVIVSQQWLGLNFDLTGRGQTFLDQQRVVLDLSWDPGSVRIASTSAYAYQNSQTFCDCDYSPRVSSGGAFHSLFDTSIRNLSQELRIEWGEEGGVRWLAGVNWFEEESVTGRVNVPTPPILPFVELTNRAVFGSVSIPFAGRFTLDLDARYQKERQQRTAIPGNAAIDVEYTATLPRAILKFDASEEAMFYVSASKGSQPGQFNTGVNIPQALVEVDEETMWSYELGAKASVFDERLALNAALYYIDWSNQVYRTEAVGTDGRIINILANLGGSRINGVELEGAVQLAQSLALRVGYAYTDAKYTNFISPNALRVYGDAQVRGKELPNTPKNTFTTSLSWRRALGWPQGFEGFGQLDYQWRASQTLAEVSEAETGAMNLANLRFGLDDGRLRFSIAAENLFDDETPEFATRFSDLNTSPFQFGYLIGLREPRRWSASVSYRF